MTESYNPFLQILKSFLAVIKPEEYFALRRQTVGSKLLVALIVAVLTTVGTSALYSFRVSTSLITTDALEQIPDFTYQEGVLELDQRYEYREGEIYILADSDIPYFNYANDIGQYAGAVNAMDVLYPLFGTDNGKLDSALLISKRNVVQVSHGNILSWSFADFMERFHIHSLNKQKVLSDYKGMILLGAIFIGILYLPIQLGLLFLIPILWGVVGWGVAGIGKAKSGFATTYWIGFYLNIVFAFIKCLNPILPWKIYLVLRRAGVLVRILALIIVVVQMVRALMQEESNEGCN